eukprot:1108499-Rhodomonas_salina.2
MGMREIAHGVSLELSARTQKEARSTDVQEPVTQKEMAQRTRENIRSITCASPPRIAQPASATQHRRSDQLSATGCLDFSPRTAKC